MAISNFKHILGNRGWMSLRGLEGSSIVRARCVFLEGCIDVHPTSKDPTFPDTTDLFVERCDDNMAYYHFDNQTFNNPRGVELWLNSTPGDCLPRFFRNFSKVHLTTRYAQRFGPHIPAFTRDYPGKFRFITPEEFKFNKNLRKKKA